MESCLWEKWAHAPGNFGDKRCVSPDIFLFSAYQEQALEMVVSNMIIITSRMTSANFHHEDLPNQVL